MKLVSTTISHNRESVIARMVKSVAPFVDEILIVDTGITDRTKENAREAAGSVPVRFFPFTWVNDFAAARNYALSVADTVEADWALMLDTDEWIDTGGDDIKKCLEEAERQGCKHAVLKHMTGIYLQPRFFKTPIVAKFEGPTHEAYSNWAPALTMPHARFCDEPKTPEQQKEKLLRDVQILEKHIKRPDQKGNPRWLYYLADTYANLNRKHEAIRTFRKCADMKGWDEQGAWSCYREAAIWLDLGKEKIEELKKQPTQPPTQEQLKAVYKMFEKAIETCAYGLSIHPGIPELAWLAAYCCHECGKQAQAICWAKTSIGLGKYKGIGKSVNRISFTYPMAQFELPFQILESSYRSMGLPEEAEKARVKFEIARKYRESESK